MKIEHPLIQYTKKNKFNMDLRPKVRPDATKLLEETIGRIFSDLNRSNIFFFLVLSPTVIEIKTKKWDVIKLKSFCTAKETISKTKRQSTEREKIFANDSTHKALISKIYKTARTYQSPNNPIKK